MNKDLMKPMGKEYSPEKRKQFLKDNCDACEDFTYFKNFSPEEVQGHKEELANVEMQIQDINDEKKEVVQGFNERLKPLEATKKEMIDNIRLKGESVKEVCYKFVRHEDRTTLYYNADGDCVGCRPCTAAELQSTIQQTLRATGTEG